MAFTELTDLVRPISSPGSGHTWNQWLDCHGMAGALHVVNELNLDDGPIMILVADSRRLQMWESELRFLLHDYSNVPCHVIPEWECLPWDNFSPHQDIVSERLRSLYQLTQASKGIFVTTVAAAMHRLAPAEFVKSHAFALKQGDTLDIAAFRERLVQSAYVVVNQVLEPGEFAVRGGLIDIFPMGAATPFRIDFFDNEVESIRLFDPGTQKSTATVAQISVLPAREFPLTSDGIRTFRQRFRQFIEGDPNSQNVYREVSKGNAPQGVEFYLALFFDGLQTLFDYMPAGTRLIFDRDTANSVLEMQATVLSRYEAMSIDVSRRILTPAKVYLQTEEFWQLSGNFECTMIMDSPPVAPALSLSVQSSAALIVNTLKDHPQPVDAIREVIEQAPRATLVLCESPGRREILFNGLVELNIRGVYCESFREFMSHQIALGLCVADVERGVEHVGGDFRIITEQQLYGERVLQRRRRNHKAPDYEAIIRSLADLVTGAPVVHEDHGVGRYAGLTTLEIEGRATEFLTLEYFDGDRLYVPVLSLHLVTRYVGGDSSTAPLHRLGSDVWEKARQQARTKAYDVAVELLELEALRNAREGHAYSYPHEFMNKFVDGFPFELTDDQRQAIDDTIDNMIAPKSMDRLVCGDVGFGKTEVAMRAALVAVADGKQVAVLVPTTLLAQQHYESFRERFATLGISVAVLSRFKSRAEQNQLIHELALGRPDIIIGTHRLIQSDIVFKDLGLLVIDEEHRFGVRQKERIKKVRTEVDILTLTATPIPRTLNMSLAGMRDISIIATPPRERLSVKTFQGQWQNDLVQEACLREIRRGGQVFVVHNEVRTINTLVDRLRKIMPNAKIALAHGQMPERELEMVMKDFYHQRFEILACTTIIESGIDVPTANTIIINRADRYGLAQLHQLRGRVGRSHHQAYAYLLVEDSQALTADASKRLDIMTELDDLGAGFALASHDLEIRGAGELLGESQSGSIDEVGFTLYSDFLSRAIHSIRNGTDQDSRPLANQHFEKICEVNLHCTALFPGDFISDIHGRLMLYKRISSCADQESLESIESEVIDRFGTLPEAARNLFLLARVRLQLSPFGIEKIDISDSGGRLVFIANPPLDPVGIIRLVHSQSERYRMQNATTLRISGDFPDLAQRLQVIKETLDELRQALIL